MKPRTAQRLAILIAVLVVIGVAGFFTQRFQVNRLAVQELKKADAAFATGDFARAATLYLGLIEQRLPNRPEIQIKYADTLLKMSRSTSTLSMAAGIYSEILRKDGSRDDVRRLLLNLKVDMGQFVSSRGQENGADVDVKILLERSDNKKEPEKKTPDNKKSLDNKTDGNLWYIMGRCHEAAGDDKTSVDEAVKSYKNAIKYNAPKQVDAAERLATLLYEKLNQPKAAQNVIDELVKSAEQAKAKANTINTRRLLCESYLARGRFLLALAAHDESKKSLESDATKEFEKARALDPTEPEVYLQLAQAAMKKGKSGFDEARQILEEGLKATGCDLRLIFPPEDMSNIPNKGENLIVVAVLPDNLHFRVFDRDGIQVIDTDELTKLPTAAAQIKNLRSHLKGLKPFHELTEQEKSRVIRAIGGGAGGVAQHKLTEQEKSRVIRDIALITGYIPPTRAALYETLGTLETYVGNVNGAE